MSESKDYKVISVTKSVFDEFQEMKNLSIFKKIEGLANKDLFLLAMTLGYKNQQYKPITGSRHSGGFFRVETLNDEEKGLIKAIAIQHSKDKINILNNPKEFYQIAENYANGGIDSLKKLISEFGDFFINLAKKCE